MFAKALGSSGQFTVLERDDLEAIDREAARNGSSTQQVGADILVIGSLTEFGLADRPWKTYFLSVEKGAVAISGGASQGLTPGMKLSVKTLGKQVKSGQTGFLVRLPGTEIAKIEVTQNFGDSPETEGSLVKVISGSLGKHDPNKLVIEEIK